MKSIIGKITFILVLCCIFSVAFSSVTQAAKPKLNEKKITIAVGQKFSLKVKKSNKKTVWSTSNKKIAKVNKKGIVQGIKKGTAFITAKVDNTSLKCKVKVKPAILYRRSKNIKVSESKMIVLTHFSENVFCTISDPQIATVVIEKPEMREEGVGYESILVIYPKNDGKAVITLSNNCNKKKLKLNLTVKKGIPANAKDKLKQYVIENGQLENDDLNMVITNSNSENQKARVIYDYWEKELDYEYKDISESREVRWTLLGVSDPAGDCYAVMWITKKGETESKYVTARIDLKKYNGETLTYENAWFREPVSQEYQDIANEVTKRAFQEINDLISPLNITLNDVFNATN